MIKYEDTAEAWNERVSGALEYRREYGREDFWARIEAMYSNLAGSGAEIGPNVIFGMADALTSSLDVYNPKITISPSMNDPDSVESYPIVQAVDDWLMQELDVAEIVQDVTLHAFLWGRGIIKLGYDSEWGFDSAFDVGTYQSPMGMTLTQFAKNGKRIEYGRTAPGMPWIAPVLPQDFIVPWGVKYLEQAPWVAHRVIRHIDLLRADPKYEKTRDLSPTLSMKDVVDSYHKPTRQSKTNASSRVWIPKATDLSTEAVEFVELYEIHNYVTGRIVVVSDTKVHRNDVDRLQVEGVPFCAMTLNRHPRTFWATPPADYLRFHQAEQFDISIQRAKQRRINSLKFLVREGAITPAELEKALSTDVGIGAFMRQNSDLQRDLTIMPTGTNAELWQEAEVARRDSRETVGLSRNQLGEYDASSRRTASEATFVQQGASQRLNARQANVARLYTDVFRKLNQVIFTFWKTPRIVKVSSDKWPSFTGDDIKAEYSYQTSFGFAKSTDTTARRQEAFQLYTVMSADPYVDQAELRRYLSRVFHDVEFDRLFTEESLNAGVRMQMSAMQQGGGAIPQNARTKAS